MIRITSPHLMCRRVWLWSARLGGLLCADKALQTAADAQLKKAEELERAGQATRGLCRRRESGQRLRQRHERHEGLKQRTAKAIGAEDEKKSHLKTRLSGMFARRRWPMRAACSANWSRPNRTTSTR